MRFTDKIVVITGAGAGIGLATAKVFAAEGAIVVVNDVRGQTAANAAAAIESQGHRAFASQGDVADASRVGANVAEIIEKFGRIDILVNNAGGPFYAPAEIYTEFAKSLSINLGGAFNWSQAVAVASMIPNRSGAIVNVSSSAGLAAVSGDVGYVTAKHGIIGMTKALAVEWAKYGIRVNCTAPGTTDTSMVQLTKERDPAFIDERVSRIPLGRISAPQEQARAIAFLASDDATYISGITLPVDGGQMALHSGAVLRAIK